MTTSFAHTRAAETNRTDKAAALVVELYAAGYAADDTLRDITNAERRRLERCAGVRRCSDLTWTLAFQMLGGER